MDASHRADLHVQRIRVCLLKAALAIAMFRGALNEFTFPGEAGYQTGTTLALPSRSRQVR